MKSVIAPKLGSLVLKKAFIEKHRHNAFWEVGNKTLYKLCRNFPEHQDAAAIIGKLWLIGRAYGASIERRPIQSINIAKKNNDSYYEEDVVPKIQKANLDEQFKVLRAKSISTTEIIQKHFLLMSVFREISNLNKRSLASKYLHFHFPRLFFIYDSRARKALRDLMKKSGLRAEKSVVTLPVDGEYASFYTECKYLQDIIRQNYKLNLDCREIDNILLSWASCNGY